jgi:DNA-binding NarL/FixJ family response regulator
MTDSATRHTILIIDDHPLYREGLKRFIEAQPNLTCCGEADSCQSAFEVVRRSAPELVVLDLRLRREDGTELMRNLLVENPSLRFLVLSQGDETVHAEQALRAGAAGYIMKEEATEELLTAINQVLSGEMYVSRRLSALVLKRFFRSADRNEITEDLTDRELQVFQFLGGGMGVQEISKHLHLSAKTVETHRENIKHKLKLPGAAAVVRAARDWLNRVSR